MAAGPAVGEPHERDRSDQGSLANALELPKGTEMTEPANDGPNPPTVAVLGLGKMETPIAHYLVAAGFPVVVWNRRPEPVPGPSTS
jgi:lactate dehydrogenase-like 2-hydroxyacid dehydrogenase